jgi:L-threonylcarbamoyladenylate synthase
MDSVHQHKHLNIVNLYAEAARALEEGGIVALPTDTVYGLCAVAADAAAVERIYEIKHRDPRQPLPIFVASLDQAELIGELSDDARALAHAFWPGPLTIVVPVRQRYRSRALAGGSTVGLRIPDDPALRELAAQLGPLTGTSANIAGAPDCRSAEEVRTQLGDAVDVIVDAPVPAAGVPSTIVDCTVADCRILREGAVSSEAIARLLAGSAELR